MGKIFLAGDLNPLLWMISILNCSISMIYIILVSGFNPPFNNFLIFFSRGFKSPAMDDFVFKLFIIKDLLYRG